MDFILNERNIPQTSAIEKIVFTSPQKSTDYYFRDSIGNVSTSRVNGNLVILTPRYPLFGGWKYSFEAGYETPLILNATGIYYLFLNLFKGVSYEISVPFIGGIKGLFLSENTVKVILPEGAT